MLSTPPAFILSQDQTLMLKVLIQPEYLAFLNQKQVPTGILIQVLLFLRFALLKAVRSSFDDLNYSLMNLSRLFTVQLSMFFVLLSCDSLIILSNRCSFVKHFFLKLCFKFSVLRQLVHSIKMFFICQELFYFLLYICFKAKESAGGGIRTHAPLRTNGFQDRLVMTTSIPLRVTINT